MTLDLPTLFALNVLGAFVFTAATGLTAYKDPEKTYWRSWSICFLLGTLSLGFILAEMVLGSLNAYLIGNFLLVPCFFFYHDGNRRFVGKALPKAYLLAGLAVSGFATIPAALTGDTFFASLFTQLTIMTVNIATVLRYLSASYGTLSSRHGIILANLVMGVSAGIQALYFLSNRQPVLGLSQDMILTIQLLATNLFLLLSGTFMFALDHERTAERNRDAALRDPLTSACNRRAFERYLTLRLAQKTPDPFALMILDLDHFKSINDRFGHPVGDRVLVAVVAALRDILPPPHFVARLGGEEFAVVLPYADAATARSRAEAVRSAIEACSFTLEDGSPVQVSASIGLYHGDGDGLRISQLLAEIDKGLYTAKDSGRNRIVTVTGVSKVGTH